MGLKCFPFHVLSQTFPWNEQNHWLMRFIGKERLNNESKNRSIMKAHEQAHEHRSCHLCLKIICEVAKFTLIGVATTLGFKALKEAEKAKRYVEEHRH